MNATRFAVIANDLATAPDDASTAALCAAYLGESVPSPLTVGALFDLKARAADKSAATGTPIAAPAELKHGRPVGRYGMEYLMAELARGPYSGARHLRGSCLPSVGIAAENIPTLTILRQLDHTDAMVATDHVDHRSHTYILATSGSRFYPYWLIVRHGGGAEFFRLDLQDYAMRPMLALLQSASAHDAFWLADTLVSTASDSYRAGRSDMGADVLTAKVKGTLAFPRRRGSISLDLNHKPRAKKMTPAEDAAYYNAFRTANPVTYNIAAEVAEDMTAAAEERRVDDACRAEDEARADRDMAAADEVRALADAAYGDEAPAAAATPEYQGDPSNRCGGEAEPGDIVGYRDMANTWYPNRVLGKAPANAWGDEYELERLSDGTRWTSDLRQHGWMHGRPVPATVADEAYGDDNGYVSPVAEWNDAAAVAEYEADKLLLGTPDYRGVAFFWAPEYKHELREATPAERRALHRALLRRGLPLDGVSPMHAALIEQYAWRACQAVG